MAWVAVKNIPVSAPVWRHNTPQYQILILMSPPPPTLAVRTFCGPRLRALRCSYSSGTVLQVLIQWSSVHCGQSCQCKQACPMYQWNPRVANVGSHRQIANANAKCQCQISNTKSWYSVIIEVLTVYQPWYAHYMSYENVRSICPIHAILGNYK